MRCLPWSLSLSLSLSLSFCGSFHAFSERFCCTSRMALNKREGKMANGGPEQLEVGGGPGARRVRPKRELMKQGGGGGGCFSA